ncbi:MAG: InlB B-repeat-containing protein [Treponema sp.]|nr:InlB B-repeat-containing protein [Treponema sp.]
MRKFRKHSLLVLVTAALLMTALVTGCPAPDTTSDGLDPNMGYVRLNIQGVSNLRTILPTGITVSSFSSYELKFTATSGAPAANATFTRTSSNINSSPVELVPGTYDLEVVAYTSANQVGPAAGYTQSGITIASGSANTDINISLTAYSPGEAEEEGIFSWNINLSGVDNPTSATMTITPSGKPALPDINLIGDNARPNDTETLEAGYYSVLFTIVKSSVEFKFQQALWIYQHMTSAFTFAFLDAHFGVTPLTVTFNVNGGDSLGVGGTTQVMPGDEVGDLPTPTRSGYTFLGWWTINGGTTDNTGSWGTPFTASTEVSNNITVFAKWFENGIQGSSAPTFNDNSIGGTALALQYVVNGSGGPDDVDSGTPITINVNESIVITITNVSSFENIVWTWNSDNLNAQVTNNALTIDNTSANTINTTAAITYLIFVTAGTISSGPPQSTYFTIKVEAAGP